MQSCLPCSIWARRWHIPWTACHSTFWLHAAPNFVVHHPRRQIAQTYCIWISVLNRQWILTLIIPMMLPDDIVFSLGTRGYLSFGWWCSSAVMQDIIANQLFVSSILRVVVLVSAFDCHGNQSNTYSIHATKIVAKHGFDGSHGRQKSR